MAALSDNRLVWSATLVIVVTTELMLVVFSLSTESLAVMEGETLPNSHGLHGWLVSGVEGRALWPGTADNARKERQRGASAEFAPDWTIRPGGIVEFGMTVMCMVFSLFCEA